jgi:hypothetical protein
MLFLVSSLVQRRYLDTTEHLSVCRIQADGSQEAELKTRRLGHIKKSKGFQGRARLGAEHSRGLHALRGDPCCCALNFWRAIISQKDDTNPHPHPHRLTSTAACTLLHSIIAPAAAALHARLPNGATPEAPRHKLPLPCDRLNTDPAVLTTSCDGCCQSVASPRGVNPSPRSSALSKLACCARRRRRRHPGVANSAR